MAGLAPSSQPHLVRGTSASRAAPPSAATASSGSRTRPSSAIGSTGTPSCRTRPSRTRIRRSARRAATRSCVTMMMVTWNSRLTVRKASRTRAADSESSSAVGSSASRIAGVLESAAAIATRCCSPPESIPGVCFARSVRPTSSRRPSTSCFLATWVRRTVAGRRMLSRTDRYGTRLRAVPCHTKPTRSARYSVSSSSPSSPRSRPSTSTMPADARSSPPTRFRIVDLPAPLGPTTARNSAGWTSRSTPPRATTPTSPTR